MWIWEIIERVYGYLPNEGPLTHIYIYIYIIYTCKQRKHGLVEKIPEGVGCRVYPTKEMGSLNPKPIQCPSTTFAFKGTCQVKRFPFRSRPKSTG